MKRKRTIGLFWELLSEDRDLVFFIIGFIVWVINLVAELGGLNTESWLWVMSRIAIPLFLITGIVLYVRKHYRLANQLTSTKHLPAVFVVGKPREDIQSSLASAQESITRLTGFRAFRQMEDIFNVRFDYLVSYQRKKLQPDMGLWKDFIEDAERSIRRFSDAVSGEKIYHIFVNGPASLALGLGVVFGTKSRMVVYQFRDEQYEPVLDLRQDIRRVKEIVMDAGYQYIKVSRPRKLTLDTAIVLEMASHPAAGDVRAYLKGKNLQMAIVKVSNTYGGNLRENDWTKVIQELHSVLHQLLSKAEVSRLHLFHAMPVAMAFGLGAALGNFVPITVYNLERLDEVYYPVLKLNEMESFV